MSITSERIKENGFIHHLMDEAAEEIETLESRVAELEAELQAGRQQWMVRETAAEERATTAVQQYKDSVMKLAGEPVLYAEFAEDGGWLGAASEYADHLEEPHALFTSDQVAAAILKATKPLEEEVEFQRTAHRRAEEMMLEQGAQLAAAQEEIKTVTEQKNRMWFEMQTAQNQLAKTEQRVAEYNELIYAVQTKTPDETRHQTALRYIRNAENRPSNATANGASS